MKKKQTLTIGIRLGIGFAVILAITLVVGGVSIWRMWDLAAKTQKLYDHPFTVSNAVLRVEKNIIAIHRTMKDVALAKNEDEIEKYVKIVDNLEKEILKEFEDEGKIEDRFLGDESMYKEAKQAIIDWKPIRDSVIKDMKAGNREAAALTTKTTGVKHIEKIDEKMVALENYASNKAINFMKGANSTKIITISIMSVLIGIAILLGIVISILITRSITKPINKIVDFANNISDGDLEFSSNIKESNDEIGLLVYSFNKMLDALRYKLNILRQIAEGSGDFTIDVRLASDRDILGKTIAKMLDSLNNILGQVNSSISQVDSGVMQVSSASQILSQGASEQASSLEEISSSITEINSQSKQNAKSAENANEYATKAKDNALEGNKLMTDLVEAMSKINSSSDEIKKIVKVIDDIAFQTNLLALNANVEAARAGKYGKGFAVVAEEVRNLASRSAEAVKETTGMVEDSIKNIVSSNDLVNKTSKQLEEIVKGAQEVVNLVEEITLASREQAQGLDQVAIGLGQIDQVTQSNTANAEESASVAEELSSQTQLLKNMISKFKLKALGTGFVKNNLIDKTEDNQAQLTQIDNKNTESTIIKH